MKIIEDVGKEIFVFYFYLHLLGFFAFSLIFRSIFSSFYPINDYGYTLIRLYILFIFFIQFYFEIWLSIYIERIEIITILFPLSLLIVLIGLPVIYEINLVIMLLCYFVYYRYEYGILIKIRFKQFNRKKILKKELFLNLMLFLFILMISFSSVFW